MLEHQKLIEWSQEEKDWGLIWWEGRMTWGLRTILNPAEKQSKMKYFCNSWPLASTDNCIQFQIRSSLSHPDVPTSFNNLRVWWEEREPPTVEELIYSCLVLWLETKWEALVYAVLPAVISLPVIFLGALSATSGSIHTLCWVSNYPARNGGGGGGIYPDNYSSTGCYMRSSCSSAGWKSTYLVELTLARAGNEMAAVR